MKYTSTQRNHEAILWQTVALAGNDLPNYTCRVTGEIQRSAEDLLGPCVNGEHSNGLTEVCEVYFAYVHIDVLISARIYPMQSDTVCASICHLLLQ